MRCKNCTREMIEIYEPILYWCRDCGTLYDHQLDKWKIPFLQNNTDGLKRQFKKDKETPMKKIKQYRWIIVVSYKDPDTKITHMSVFTIGAVSITKNQAKLIAQILYPDWSQHFIKIKSIKNEYTD